jgi:hypothetical protein
VNRGSRKKIGVVLLALASLLLSGCSNPSDAASFKSGKITNKKLQASISTILDERIKFNTTPQEGFSGDALTRNQLEFHIFSALLTKAAQERKVLALPGEISARRAEVLQNVGGEDQLSVALVNAGIASIDLDEYLALILLQDKLRAVIAPNATDDGQVVAALQKMLTETAVSEKLVVNPRYGTWNVQTNRVEPADPTEGALPAAKQ